MDHDSLLVFHSSFVSCQVPCSESEASPSSASSESIPSNPPNVGIWGRSTSTRTDISGLGSGFDFDAEELVFGCFTEELWDLGFWVIAGFDDDFAGLTEDLCEDAVVVEVEDFCEDAVALEVVDFAWVVKEEFGFDFFEDADCWTGAEDGFVVEVVDGFVVGAEDGFSMEEGVLF